jgi:ferritin-like protein
MPEPRRKYVRHTKAQKLSAVLAAEIVGQQATAEQTGIPLSTIHSWMDNPEFAEFRKKTRDDMAEEMRVIAHLALSQITKRIAEFEPRDLSILLGIAIDKSQLLAGQPTDRTELLNVTDGMNDHEKATLAKLLREEIARRTPA